MGRPPAYLFVVRHGYRLDAADKQWHLSSPTPYDPPLTYSGWQQAKSLGVRIASIIRERIQEEERVSSQCADPSMKPKRKRYEVVLHSSPFLRCIQTSIAISAGLAQDSTPFETKSPELASSSPAPTSGAPSRPTLVTNLRDRGTTDPSVKIRKSVLRLDAFLGEWLSPSYFELITPPPESVMMLASAKADLLRREDYTHYPSFVSHTHSNSQGQLWSPTVRTSSPSPRKESQFNGSGLMGGFSGDGQAVQNPPASPATPGYVSPVPHYAIGNNNTIPPGYVSHARDACVAVDYQWDSTRSSLDWGDGGTFPEEWPAMHKRFRAGVQSLVDWYSTAENPTRPVTKTVTREPADSATDGDDDVEVEAVVILVSHGAGCNALIGAITHQPVLMDVGMASLTMAVHKPSKDTSGIGRWPDPRSSDKLRDTPPIHELYDLELFANTDHLRSPTETPTSSRPPSLSGALHAARSRHSSFSTSMDSFSWNDGPGSRTSSANIALSNLRKSSNNGATVPRLSFAVSTGGITVGSGVTSFTSTRPSNLGRTGLWSPISKQLEDEEDDMMLLNFGNDSKAASTSGPKASLVQNPPASANGDGALDGAADSKERSPRPDSERLGSGSSGLWGTPRPPDEADRLRDLSSHKRRWTVTERS
ncbi:uncharacterized protein B0T15DRAFT_413273 [Chaetomium strumarium]|uniref:Phosphoglycerate mutase family protein n=1 Tax=Chaetomium strumarium TaxID=1170767 RepID=A0AAJ0GV94_9PEZI|nr:hypothetical protein B0T15DRAFT_413273 [Chaetomium strumarium]